jgi:ribonuclease H2 subunit B
LASYEYVWFFYVESQLLTSVISFTELDEYLKRVETETAITTSAVKHGKDKKVVSAGESKKRKNPKGSQGVEKLKKANVNGMAKLSSFFTSKS